MGGQAIDYEAVIGDLERRRADFNAQMDAAIAALRQVTAIQAPGLPAAVAPVLPFSGPKLQPYRELSMADAAIAHIKSVGHAVKNPDLAKALEAGGFPHKSKNFANTLNSILWRRFRHLGDVRKVSGGWDVTARDDG